jgi:CBS-domain-containing membrane protein
VPRVTPESDLAEAVRLLMTDPRQHMLLVTSPSGGLEGILTHTDVVMALNARNSGVLHPANH